MPFIPSNTSKNANRIQGTPVNSAAPSDDDVLTYDSSSGKAQWEAAAGGGSGAPTDAQYWTAAADDDLDSEVVVNDEAGLYAALSDVDDFVQPGDSVHDGFGDFVANEHIDHTNVTLTAGTGLTGGGDISSNRTFNVDVGIGDDKIAQIDDADVADNDYAKFTANGLEGRSYTEVKTDLSLNNVENTAHSTDNHTMTIDGRDVSADGTKLDNIVSNTQAIAHGISDNQTVTIDDADAAADDIAYFTANGLAGYNEAEFKSAYNMEAGTDYLAQQTIGIADNNLLEVDDADATDNDYARFTANGLEGRSYAEVLSDLSGEATGAFSFNDQNVSNVGDLAVDSANGIDVNPGSDTDADLITVGVTGSPKLWWDESADAMTFNKFPVTPSAAPDADYEVANKKYVDDSHISDCYVHAGLDGDQSINSGTWTTLELDDEHVDSGSDFNTGTYTFTAPADGIYLLMGSARFNVDTAGDNCQIRLLKDGSANVGFTAAEAPGTGAFSINTQRIMSLSSGDTIALQVQNVNNNDTIIDASHITYLSIARLA